MTSTAPLLRPAVAWLRSLTLLTVLIVFDTALSRPVHAQSADRYGFAPQPRAWPVHFTALGGIGMGPHENLPDRARPGAVAAGARLAFGSARVRPTVSYTHWFWGPLGGVPDVGGYTDGDGAAILAGFEHALVGDPLRFEPYGGLEAGVLRWDGRTTPAVAGRLGAQLKLTRVLRLSTEARAQLQHVYSGIDSLVAINLGLRLCLPYVNCEV